TGAPSADLARSPSRLPAPTATPPLSLHDALPISPDSSDGPCALRAGAVARLGGSTAAAERGLRAALIVTLGHWGCHPPSTPVLIPRRKDIARGHQGCLRHRHRCRLRPGQRHRTVARREG